MRGRPAAFFRSFWTLQLVGWGGFYLLVLAASLPYLNEPGELLDTTAFVVSLFLASCALLPVCRSLVRRSLPWSSLELRAAVWCLPVGAGAALLADVSVAGTVDWRGWLVEIVQSAVVLFLWCSLYFGIEQWQASADERERLLVAEAEAREARLNALRYQLNPHFLFNALNAVSSLILDEQPDDAARMLGRVCDLLRATLTAAPAAERRLADEAGHVEQYLAIERIRLGERLAVRLDVDPAAADALVPDMLLQPLVENAVRHGIAPRVGGGEIVVASWRVGDRLHLTVSNSGDPVAAGSVAQGPTGRVGLTNTAERLRMLYGSDHAFGLEWPASGGCRVSIELPFRPGDSDGETACGR